MKEILLSAYYLPLIAGIAAFFLSTSLYLYPIIINVSRAKGLMDAPGERKMHSTQTPTLGGLGVFIAFSLSIIVFGLLSNLLATDLTKLLALIGSAIILVFLGVKDDLVSMSPKKKLLGQFLAVINVVLLTDVRIFSFEGLLGVGELPYLVSVLFTVFVFILVVNALNLIDGIDGLAGSLSMVASLSFGVFFLVNGSFLMTLVSFILMGSIIGFLRYNLSSDKKIFMGDSGSMLIGFLLAYQGVSFLNLNDITTAQNSVTNGPVILLAILSYPLFDLLRVFAIRLRQGKSPFIADANHIHHRLLRLKLGHKKATLFLAMANALVIAFAYFMGSPEIHFHLGATVLFGSVIYLIPFLRTFDPVDKEVPQEGPEVSRPEPVVIKMTIFEGQYFKEKEVIGEDDISRFVLEENPLTDLMEVEETAEMANTRAADLVRLKRKMKKIVAPDSSKNFVDL